MLSTSPSIKTGCVVIGVFPRVFLPQLVPRWTAAEKGAAAARPVLLRKRWTRDVAPNSATRGIHVLRIDSRIHINNFVSMFVLGS